MIIIKYLYFFTIYFFIFFLILSKIKLNIHYINNIELIYFKIH